MPNKAMTSAMNSSAIGFYVVICYEKAGYCRRIYCRTLANNRDTRVHLTRTSDHHMPLSHGFSVIRLVLKIIAVTFVSVQKYTAWVVTVCSFKS